MLTAIAYIPSETTKNNSPEWSGGGKLNWRALDWAPTYEISVWWEVTNLCNYRFFAADIQRLSSIYKSTVQVSQFDQFDLE